MGMSNNLFFPDSAGAGFFDIIYEYTDLNNCTNYDTNTTTVHALPNVNILNGPTSYCANSIADTLTPTVSGGSFSGDITSANIFNPQALNLADGAASVSQQIIYSLTDNNGCFNADTVTTMVHSLPLVSFGTLASTFCNNDALITLSNGTPIGGVYAGNGIIGNTFNPSTAGLGYDTLTYSFTDAHSCSNIDTVTTTILPAPDFHLANDTNICINNVLVLSTGLGSGYTLLWSDGSTGQTLTIDAANVGTGVHTYSVVVKDSQTDCEETDEIQVTINACTGIDNISQDNNVNVFPNPSLGLFTIESDLNFSKMEVYSTNGKLVFAKDIQSQTQVLTLDLRDHTPGVYYLLLMDKGSIIRKQLIIK